MKAPLPSVCLEARSLSHPGSQGGTVADVSLEFQSGSLTLVFAGNQQDPALLLRLLGLLERPVSGQVLVHGMPVSDLDDSALELRRNQLFGYVFGAPFLLPSMSVLENVAMPLFKISQLDPDEARNRINELLEFVGLFGAAEDHVHSLPPLHQKYVSVARGLANRPAVLLVEDIECELSAEEARGYCALLRRAATQLGITVVATASSAALAEPGDRAVEISQGKVVADWIPGNKFAS